MITHTLLRPEGILIVKPKAPLESTDFEKLAQEIDPFIEENGHLHGLMIDVKSFPGWKDFAGLVAHLRFVKDHHKKIRKIAVVSDSDVLSFAPKIARHFVQAQIKSFTRTQREDALHWLTERKTPDQKVPKVTSSGPETMVGTPRIPDEVQEASQESFPASDPPSWTPVAGTGSP